MDDFSPHLNQLDGYSYDDAAYNAYRFEDDLLTILYSARLARGLTRAELADRMNVAEQDIDDIEHGRTSLTVPMAVDWMIETGVQVSVSGSLHPIPMSEMRVHELPTSEALS